ncbi:M20 family metallopeptidase [Aquariibacter albus]|uniref:M20 family metallopeptidase n=1 Tax=Aquariibacter albus TaxID=2759899 RepID=A0A839HJT3_9BURK|nr:M20 family metallopeptidase [Aquariibacter albus]MBB1163017.1 M20 family metallopeptidase [Aquariibacter albus]
MNAPERLPAAAAPDSDALRAHVDRAWAERIVPALRDYIAIPAKSPLFDPDWAEHGHLEKVLRDAAAWVEAQGLKGLRLEIVRLNGPDGRPRTPVIFFELEASTPGAAVRPQDEPTVLLYGHLDKQPEFDGWKTGLGPWTPVLQGDRLYGRGSADDGYAVYSAVTALAALQAQGLPHPRCVGLFESCEESGSGDLPAYLDTLRLRLGDVQLVVCLDSGAGNYEQLWLTSSLRGNVTGTLRVEVLDEGVHSGDGSGLVPSSFRILRHLLDRLEDSASGRVLPESFHAAIPAERVAQAHQAAAILGAEVWKRYPWACGADGGFVLPVTTDPAEVLLNRTWRPTLSVTGADGFPATRSAGNVLRPFTAFKLSLRLPPGVDGHLAAQRLKALLEDQAPYNARVTFEPDGRAGPADDGQGPARWGATGWNAPSLAPWLDAALEAASRTHFGASYAHIGQGGTIPLMSLLEAGFPKAQMMVCGVLGPKSNAHGPNEFLHLPYAQRLTASVAEVIAAFARTQAATPD